MGSPTSIEQKIVDYLNEYCFQKIWQEPISELRNNVQPIKLHERTRTGTISYMDLVIELPIPSRAYYIYGADVAAYRGSMDLPPLQWIPTHELCNLKNILFHTYTESGIMLHKAFVYIYFVPHNNCILIAIEKQMYDSVVPIQQRDLHKTIYTTVYFDSDYVNNIYIHSVKIPFHDLNLSISKGITDFLDEHDNPNIEQRIAFQQGQEIPISEAYTLYSDEYVDVIADKNIIASFDVDLTYAEYNQGYFSEKDKTFKIVVHIPKALNLDNKIISHNTCDFFIRKHDIDNTRQQHLGRYIHRCAELSIGQITHNDFSIPTYILDAHRDHLNTENVTLHVVCRQHDKDNVLLKEQAYLYLLYGYHTDEQILEFLTGNGDERLPFWTARELEQSKFTEFMFDVPSPVQPQDLPQFVDALGYYHTVALLCSRIEVAEVTDATLQKWKFRKSFIYEGVQVHANVYHNGWKVLPQHYDVINEYDAYYIKFTDNIVMNVGDIIVSELYVTGPTTMLYQTVSLTNRTFEIPYPDVVVYKEHDSTPYLAKGVKSESYKSYELVDPIGNYNITTSTINPNYYTINIGYPLYGSKIIIANKLSSFNYQYDLNPSMIEGNTLAVTLTRISNDNNMILVPILNFYNCDVFLNGRYLVRDIDYTLIEVKHPHTGFVSFYQILLQNMSYLEDTETTQNRIELVLNCTDIEDISSGFVVNNLLIPDSPVHLYFPEISSVLVNGRFEHDITDFGQYYLTPSNKYLNHHTFEVKTCIPKFLQELLLKYHPNTDKERIVTLNEYFYNKIDVLPDKIILQASHQLYSIYLNTIIRDIVWDTFQISYDPDLTKLENQLKNYLHIKPYDLVFKEGLDLNHIDVFPHYRQFLVDATTKLLITNLIKALMPQDLVGPGDEVHYD
jgi:hypothetical protein